MDSIRKSLLFRLTARRLDRDLRWASNQSANSRPVSYTHLDVYKRQGMTWRLLSLGGRETIKADARQACFIEWCLTCSADPREESLDGK